MMPDMESNIWSVYWHQAWHQKTIPDKHFQFKKWFIALIKPGIPKKCRKLEPPAMSGYDFGVFKSFLLKSIPPVSRKLWIFRLCAIEGKSLYVMDAFYPYSMLKPPKSDFFYHRKNYAQNRLKRVLN